MPSLGRPDAPRLLYRYQADEDYFALPLQADGGGTWSAQIALRTNPYGIFLQKSPSATAETPEHQLRVRARPYAAKFEITYHYRPYRKLAKKTVAFDNGGALPIIHAARGTEVELLVHASRPVQSARVEIIKKLDFAGKVPSS